MTYRDCGSIPIDWKLSITCKTRRPRMSEQALYDECMLVCVNAFSLCHGKGLANVLWAFIKGFIDSTLISRRDRSYLRRMNNQIESFQAIENNNEA